LQVLSQIDAEERLQLSQAAAASDSARGEGGHSVHFGANKAGTAGAETSDDEEESGTTGDSTTSTRASRKYYSALQDETAAEFIARLTDPSKDLYFLFLHFAYFVRLFV
jgi:hypothetical protein